VWPKHDEVVGSADDTLMLVDPHRLAEARSLAFHRVVAERMVSNPAILERARDRVQAWLAQGIAPYYARAWERILRGDVDQLHGGATGWCLEAHDLVLWKYAAGREKDDHFVRAAIAAGLVDPRVLIERLATLPADGGVKERLGSRILADAATTPSAADTAEIR
jgi:hypothetical protein